MDYRQRKLLHIWMIIFVCSFRSILCSKNYFTSNSESFESVPTTVKTNENDTVLLPCHSAVPTKYIRWLRDDAVIVDSRHPEKSPPPRITLFNNGDLQVREVNMNDTGEYLCEIMTSELILETQLHAIEVLYPPKVISSPSGRHEIKLGSVFEIVCTASGVPHPIISWQHNGISSSTSLENNRRRLVEVNDRRMAGTIECIATNGVGTPARAGIDMIVLFPPEVKATIATVHTNLRMNAQLECVAVALPQANIHWFHHGIPVVSSNRIARQDHAILQNQTISEYHTDTKHILIIKNIRENDFGMYDCRAENALGTQSKSIELTGRPMPPVFKRSLIGITSHDSHNLIWQTESLSPIFEHKLKFRQVPSGNITPHNRKQATSWIEMIIPADTSDGPIHTTGYTLKGLMPASVYEVAVVSRNRFGWSDSSRTIRFATSGEIELPNYSTESNEDENNNYEDEIQNYSDDSSSSGYIPDPTMDIIENNDLYDHYHSMASKNSQKRSLLFASILFIYSLIR